MKKHHIYLLIVPIIALFIIGSVFLQSQTKHWMLNQIEEDLLIEAKLFTKLLQISHVEKQISALDSFVDKFDTGNKHRITIINIDGTVMADSQLSIDEIHAIENHADRPELKNAKKDTPGISIRFSNTLNTEMMYLTIPLSLQDFDGFIRVSIPLYTVDQYLSNLHETFISIALVGFVLLIIILVMTIQFIDKINSRHQQELEARVDRRTRYITMMQKFGQMLTACTNINEISEVVSTTASIIFKDSSGTLSLTHPSLDHIETITTWGDEWPGDTAYHPNDCWAYRKGAQNLSVKGEMGFFCKHISAQNPVFCVPLMAQGISIGSISVIAPVEKMTPRYQGMILAFSELITLSIANINLQKKLENQAVRDPLTNLFNRRYLDESLTREIQRADRRKTSIGIMMIDVDHFKYFNDTFGHEAGDFVLQKFGILMTKLVRGEDIPCRYGGEEFTLIIPEADLTTTQKRAMEILDQIRTMDLQFRNKTLGNITISIGISVFPGHGTTSDSLIRSADQALYLAKSEGRDQVQVYQHNPESISNTHGDNSDISNVTVIKDGNTKKMT